jgi:hypothetical protein
MLLKKAAFVKGNICNLLAIGIDGVTTETLKSIVA